MLTLTAATLAVALAALVVVFVVERRAATRRRAVESQLALVDHAATMARVSQRLTTLGFR